MDPVLLWSVVGFLTLEGCCFACAYNNVFRRLGLLESRMSSLEAARIASEAQTAIPVATVVPSAPPQAQLYYYPPRPVAGDDPLPVTYVPYYQNGR